MLKLFNNIGVRLVIYTALTLLGIWFYLSWQEPTLLNQIIFGVFGGCLLICYAIDIKVAIDRFLNTSNN